MRRTRCYVAGPISKGDVEQNVRNACDIATKLITAGYSVLCPHLTAYLQGPKADLAAGFEHTVWMEVDLPWVEVSDVLFRMPGESAGADQEVAHAQLHNIPVTTSVDWLLANVPPTKPSGGDTRFHSVTKEMDELHTKKQQDYGKKGDPFANIRATQHWGLPSWLGAMIRLNDKIIRLQSFAKNGSLANEGVEDSLIDIANYAVIALILFREEQAKTT